jgi:hypothetical protein
VTASSSRSGDLLLKVTAPRVPMGLLARPRLSADGPALRDTAALLVQAPPGFGKTSLLAQWRLEHLARGAAVAWASAQAADEVDRLVRTFAMAVRVGTGRPAFEHVLLEGGAAAGLEGITLWVAEVAQSALELVLVVDEADRLHVPSAGSTKDDLAKSSIFICASRPQTAGDVQGPLRCPYGVSFGVLGLCSTSRKRHFSSKPGARYGCLLLRMKLARRVGCFHPQILAPVITASSGQ